MSPLPESEKEADVVLGALLELGGRIVVPVRGDSMRPSILAGDRVEVGPFDGAPRAGDIAVARVGGAIVAHRVVASAPGAAPPMFRLRGDAPGALESWVPAEDLLGRVVAVLRAGRRRAVGAEPLGARARRLLDAARRRAALLRRALAAFLAVLCAVVSLRASDEAIAPSPEYRFGPGDVLAIRVWNGQKVDELKLTVQSDGEAFLPVMGIGALKVAGQSVVQLKRDLVERFSAIYKETHVELLITRYAGHHVYLMGDVKTTARNDSGPGEWPLKGPTRLIPFLSEHGGPSQDADVMRIQLIRPGAERRELNLFRAVFQGIEEDNPLLASGDLVYLPSLSMGNRKVFVLGEVNSPGIVNIIDKLGLVEAITRAGGFTQRGYMKGVVVVKRGPDGAPDMRTANFKDMFKGRGLEADIPLAPGDIVFVPRRAIATLQEVFSIIAPALGIIESIYIIDRFQKD